MAKVKIDEATCVACGVCVDMAPEIFKIDEDKGVAVVIKEEVDGELLEKAKEAAENCPSGAIIIEE